MTAACRNRNSPRVTSQTQSSSVETKSYTVMDKFTRCLDKPLASDCCCIP